PAAAFLLLAYCFLFSKLEAQLGALYAGFFLGLATMTEYTAAFSGFIALVYVLVMKAERSRALSLVLGSLVGIVATMMYHLICFGSFFTTASSMSNPEFLEAGRWGGLIGPFAPTVVVK